MSSERTTANNLKIANNDICTYYYRCIRNIPCIIGPDKMTSILVQSEERMLQGWDA